MNSVTNKFSCLVFAALLFFSGQIQAYTEMPEFNQSTDILIAQFDFKPDRDDVHTLAALGSFFSHPNYSNINKYGVIYSYGIQLGDVVELNDLRPLVDAVFGSGPGPYTWTNAENTSESVQYVADIAENIIQSGGHVFVQEAGQSDFTQLWVQELIDRPGNGVRRSVTQNHIFIVQHSNWNEDHTSPGVIKWLTNYTSYIKVPDGNSDKNTSPDYHILDQLFLANKVPDNTAGHLWKMADSVIGSWSADYSYIDEGGVDFSDFVENWAIFDLDNTASTVAEFWDNFVLQNTDLVDSCQVIEESDGLVVFEVETAGHDAINWQGSSGFGAFGQFYESKTDSFYKPGVGEIEYAINISTPGRYQFQMRSLAPGDDITEHNDVFIQLLDQNDQIVNRIINYDVNGEHASSAITKGWHKIYVNRNNAWYWDASNVHYDASPIIWELTPGRYTFKISARSAGHCIDRFVLWKEGYNLSNDKGRVGLYGAGILDSLTLSNIICENKP